jgi:hypothetical protein
MTTPATQVSIQGTGVAACCCAQLLLMKDMRVNAVHEVRPSLPVVLLSRGTQSLLCDVFEDTTLFRNALPIEKRVVLWGGQAAPVEVPHSGVAMPEADLLQRLWQTIRGPVSDVAAGSDWLIRSAKTHPENVRHFGTRTANAASVKLNGNASHKTCWVESSEDGWLFLLPAAEGAGSLLSVGGPAQLLLGKSRLVADQILEVKDAVGAFPAYPRILHPLSGSGASGTGWIACGTAAMGFDPICGEGVGHAVREAILVTAVLQAIANDFPAEEVLAHYSSRLLAGFFRHLIACREFYLAAHQSEWWNNELQLIQDGIQWTREELDKRPSAGYRLAGFDLEKCA